MTVQTWLKLIAVIACAERYGASHAAALVDCYDTLDQSSIETLREAIRQWGGHFNELPPQMIDADTARVQSAWSKLADVTP